jgi:hypothetical protein
VNGRAFRGEPTSRAELFAELERPALKALPQGRFELAEREPVTVNIDYHVTYGDASGRHYCSVPYTLVHQKLEARAAHDGGLQRGPPGGEPPTRARAPEVDNRPGSHATFSPGTPRTDAEPPRRLGEGRLPGDWGAGAARHARRLRGAAGTPGPPGATLPP